MAGMMMVDPNDPNAQQPGEPPADAMADQGQPPQQDMAQDSQPPGMMMQGQPQLDTAATANQPQQADPDAVTFTTMVAGLRKHIFGAGEAGIVKAMTEADQPGRVLGEVVFSLLFEAGKQAQQAGRDLGMDILIGVATEVIDDICELMAAHGMQISDNDKQFALLYAQALYTQKVAGSATPDDRNAAKAMLAQQKQDGSLDTAVSYVQQKGMEAGVDPFGVKQMQQRPGMMSGKGGG